jgi:hypothetical protein
MKIIFKRDIVMIFVNLRKNKGTYLKEKNEDVWLFGQMKKHQEDKYLMTLI